MKSIYLVLIGIAFNVSIVNAQNYSGVLTHTNNYFTVEPYSNIYDDGSRVKMFYDGNSKKLVWWTSHAGTTFANFEVGNLTSSGTVYTDQLIATPSQWGKIGMSDGAANRWFVERATSNTLSPANMFFRNTSDDYSMQFFGEEGTILVNGKVGIGTTTPTSKLEIKGGSTKLSSYVHIADFDDAIGTSSLISRDENTMFWNGGVVVGRYSNNAVGSLGHGNLIVKGKAGIGTTNPTHKLDVNGTIHAKEVLVDLDFPGPDYVFEEGYDLTSLSDLDAYLKENKHLPEVPSAAQMQEEGVNLVEMEMLLLKKVEELTLYVIELEKSKNEQINDLLQRIEKLEKE